MPLTAYGDDIMIEVIMRGSELYEHNKWSRDHMMEYSNSLLKNTIKHAYENCSFYKRYYSSFGIDGNDIDHIHLNQLPEIDKDIVRENFLDISEEKINPGYLNEQLKKEKLLTKLKGLTLVHTSGSTGKPCNFLYDRNALLTVEANYYRMTIDGENPIGLKDLPIRTLYVASVGSGYASTALASNGIRSYGSISKVINANEPVNSWIRKIKRFKPNYLAGYPSCIKIIGDLQEKGELCIKPKKIVTGGEPLSRETSEYFKRVFGADVINQYGCTESVLIGAGASWYDGMYLYDDMNYAETNNKGELIITTLYNSVFPLIRYRLNDVVEGFSRESSGPLPYAHIDRLIGRSEEMMWFKNPMGNWEFLHPLFIDDLDVKGIKEYQFVQMSDESFMLRCVKDASASHDMEKNIRKQLDAFLNKKGLDNISYKIEYADHLNIDKASGKAKMVINGIHMS